MSIPGAASPLFLGAAAAEAAGYQISRSLRFNDDDTAYLNRTPSSAGNRQTWTWSAWVKRSNLGTEQVLWTAGANTNTGEWSALRFITTDQLQFINNTSNSTDINLLTTQVFRDSSAWLHILLRVDISNATANDRIDIYINGTKVDAYSTQTQPGTTVNTGINGAQIHNIGREAARSNYYCDLYLADVYFIDGQALAPTDFGEYDDNNNWNPKAYSGTYGTNGFHLDFSDNSSNSALGDDSSGNNNDWTVNNLSVASGAGNDSLIDTPTNYDAASGNNGGNYCTLNPLHKTAIVGSGTSPTFSNGNLDVTGNNQETAGTFGASSGKWYYEVTQHDAGNFTNGVGWYREGTSEESIYRDDGAFRFNGSESSYGASWQSAGDVIGIALDIDSNTIAFYKNGSSQGNAKTNLPAGTYIPLIYCRQVSDLSANFGQRPFAYTPPTGYKSLCTQNLPDPTIADGSTAFDAVTYSGNGTTQTITGINHSPDFVWIKCRNDSVGHQLFDQVRGAGKSLLSNTTDQERTNHIYGYLSAFTSDGFTVTAGSSDDFEVNGSSETYVAWSWDAGTTTASNTDGSITSSVRANQSAGFSIVSYTGNGTNGATVGHGLSGAEDGMIIVKNRDFSGVWWATYHASLTTGKVVALNSTQGEFDETYLTRGIIESVTSSTFSCTAGPAGNETANGNGDTHIAYCFAPVAGYSAFGSYTGNGSTDGPFVALSFRPAVIILKRTDSNASWQIRDTSRSPNNVVTENLYPNLTNAESTDSSLNLDILSNGFKPRTSTDGGSNASGGTYIYAAFAEHPQKTARAR